MSKSPDAFRTISEVADWLGIQAHVLRFWESKFTQVKPVKRAGGRRYYRPVDMLLLGGIKKLLHDDGLTIKGVQKILREQGVEFVSEGSRSLDSPARDDFGAPGSLPKVMRLQRRISPVPAPGADPVDDPDAAPDAAPEPVSASASTASDEATDGSADIAPGMPSETGPGDDSTPEVAGDIAASSPPDQSTENTPAQPSLPSFLHRPAPADTPDAPASIAAPKTAPKAAPEPIADSPPRPMARLVEIADPPPEDEIAYRPGPLGKLARIHRLTPNQATEIAPVVADLRALFDRLSGRPPS